MLVGPLCSPTSPAAVAIDDAFVDRTIDIFLATYRPSRSRFSGASLRARR